MMRPGCDMEEAVPSSILMCTEDRNDFCFAFVCIFKRLGML